jgi:hypothetical protein
VTRALLAALLLGIAAAPAQDPQFFALDVYVETGARPLAAYQFEVTTGARIVGVEGGEPACFRAAPYYDPAALQGGRIIVAAFTLDADPPAGRVRVARLHMMESGEAKFETKLVVAAAPGGERFDARIDVVKSGGSR